MYMLSGRSSIYVQQLPEMNRNASISLLSVVKSWWRTRTGNVGGVSKLAMGKVLDNA